MAIIQALERHLEQKEGRGRRNLGPLLRKASSVRSALVQAESIDNLLDAHQDDREIEMIGKVAIARCILNAERQSMLYPRSDSKMDFSATSATWYARLAQMMFSDLPKARVERIFDNVTFVNFNYDRCIEHYFYHAIKSYYMSDIDINAIMSSLTVRHAYGKVGQLPWEGAEDAVQFGEDHPDLLNLAGRLRTFTEQVSDDDELAALREEVRSAEHLVFLGFAFHRQNMELLACESSPKFLAATTMGRSRPDKEAIEEAIYHKISKSAPEPNFLDGTCSNLIGDYRLRLMS